MHQVPMHILLQHLRINQIFTAKLTNFLFTHEFVLIIDNFAMLLLKLLSNVVNVGHPFGPRTELRDKIAANFGIF